MERLKNLARNQVALYSDVVMQSQKGNTCPSAEPPTD